MAEVNDGFEVVENKMNPMWDPCTMKNADGETIPREKTDKSFMIGYYLGMEVRTGKNAKEFTVHNFKLKAVGDKSHLSEEVKEGDNISCWGKTQLDELLVKNVAVGTLCKIQWDGKIASKANPGQKYHTFTVLQNKNETLSLDNIPAPSVQQETKPAAQPQQMAAQTTGSSSDLDDEDDVPF
ncbi:MAG: hypothetical protein ACK5B9_11500 [Flavobacteriia bacterium]|jgi:hypothetical protein